VTEKRVGRLMREAELRAKAANPDYVSYGQEKS
jgi:hypothetical protein